jgi:hypothetical protein
MADKLEILQVCGEQSNYKKSRYDANHKADMMVLVDDLEFLFSAFIWLRPFSIRFPSVTIQKNIHEVWTK